MPPFGYVSIGLSKSSLSAWDRSVSPGDFLKLKRLHEYLPFLNTDKLAYGENQKDIEIVFDLTIQPKV